MNFRSSLDGACQAASVTLRSILSEIPDSETGQVKPRLDKLLRKLNPEKNFSCETARLEDLESVIGIVRAKATADEILSIDEIEKQVQLFSIYPNHQRRSY